MCRYEKEPLMRLFFFVISVALNQSAEGEIDARRSARFRFG
jgi:hypothetical protein